MADALAVLFALLAALVFGTGNALEHRVVAAPAAGDTRVVAQVLRSPVWWLGMFGDAAAFGFQAAALANGPLLLVQPLLVCGLLFALPLSAHWSGRRLSRGEWVAATVLCAALATFLLEAAPGGGRSAAPFHRWVVVAGSVVLVAAVAGAVAMRTRGHVRAAFLGLASGALVGIGSALTKTFVEQIQHGVPFTARHWEVYALASFFIAGIVVTQYSFRTAPLSASLPALEVTEPIVAVTLGIVVLHEQFNGGGVVADLLIAVSGVGMIIAVAMLATAAGRQTADARERAEHVLEVRDGQPALS